MQWHGHTGEAFVGGVSRTWEEYAEDSGVYLSEAKRIRIRVEETLNLRSQRDSDVAISPQPGSQESSPY